MIEYYRIDEFNKDLKKLAKRFRSLPEDLIIVQKAVIELYHIMGINNLSTFEISGFSSTDSSFWKIKKFACKSLKGRGSKSGIRVIYNWQPRIQKIMFIEIYFKGDKENEDRQRIKSFIKDV